MSEQVFATPRLKKFRKQIENALDVKITIEGDMANIEGESFGEYTALSVIESLNYGFDLPIALQLKNEEFMMEKLNLKRLTRPSRLATIKGRIIGLGGKTKRLIAELTDCEIAIKDNIIAIIGRTSDVDITKQAISSLIHGSPHSSVYAFLEKNRKIRKEKVDIDEEDLRDRK
jgi:ribosomal RNA assembly protein